MEKEIPTSVPGNTHVSSTSRNYLTMKRHPPELFSTWKHLKTNSTYTVLGVADCSTNGEREGVEQSVVYISHTQGKMKYREVSEFLDGRFVRIS